MLSEQFDEYIKNYRPNRVICKEGQSGDSFFLIKEGLAEVTRRSDRDRTVTLSTLGPGEIFGEMALLNDEPVRSATVQSKTRLICWKFSGDKFEALLEQSEEFRRRVMQLLNERLRDSNRKMSRIRSLYNTIYHCSFLLLNLVDRLGPLAQTPQTLEFTPDRKTLTSWFSEPYDLLQALLHYPSPEQLDDTSDAVKSRLLRTARRIVEDGLDKLSFHPRSESGTPELEEQFPRNQPEKLLAEAETLHAQIHDRSPIKDEDILRQLRREYNQLKGDFKRENDEQSHDKTDRQIEIYLKEIQRILFSE